MGLFNEHPSFVSNTKSSDIHDSSVQGQPGLRGLPGIGFRLTSDNNYDISNKKLTNVKNGDADNDVMVKSQIEGYVSDKTKYLEGVNPGQVINNKAVIYSPSGSIHTNDLYLKDKNGQEVHFYNEDQDLNQCRLYVPNLKNNDSYGGRLKSSVVVTSINQTIEGKKIFHDIEVPTPTIDGHASNKAYVDNEISKISDASDNSNYVKKDGSVPMTGNLDMNNNRIQNLPFPISINEPTTLGFVNQINNNLLNSYLDLEGSRRMKGDLNMDNHRITNIKTPFDDTDAVNIAYLNNHSIQAAHPQKNILDYIMDDIDLTTSQYGMEVDKIDDYNGSFHTYNKKVIYLKLLKDGNNYRARIGYNMFKRIDKIKDRYYTCVIEWLTTDNNVWNKMEIFNNITQGSIISSQTRKFENGLGLYYTRSIVQFEIMAISTPPIYLLSTVHIDGVNPTYPDKFSEVYNIIYGIDGKHTTISPNVYDTHEAFEIDKTKMKMLVPLDMNGKQLMNVNLDLKFGNIFKIENCFVHDNHPSSQILYKILRKRNNNTLVPFIISVPVVLVSFNLPSAFNIKLYDKAFIEIGERITNKITRTALKNLNTILLQIYKNGIKHIHFYNIGSSQFDLDVILSYM